MQENYVILLLHYQQKTSFDIKAKVNIQQVNYLTNLLTEDPAASPLFCLFLPLSSALLTNQ